jgi:hypothetical protein
MRTDYWSAVLNPPYARALARLRAVFRNCFHGGSTIDEQ